MDFYLYQHLYWIFEDGLGQIINHLIQYLFIAGLIFIFAFFDELFVCFSAGVGRSGTFIALDALLETAEHQDTIDILDFTHRMR